MISKDLTLSYDCLSSIGNSLELESMISEIVITFFRKTDAVFGSYYHSNEDEEPLINIGDKVVFDVKKYVIPKKDHIIFFEDDKHIFILPLKQGCLLFIYKNKEEEDIKRLASILAKFQNKINLSISACEGVYELEHMNEKLEDRVNEAVQKIRKSEKILLSQSKQAIMGEMIEMIAHQWRQPITSIGMIANNIILDIALCEFSEDKLKDDLDIINNQVMFLSNTIDDFRDFFKESKKKDRVLIKNIIDGTMTIIEKHFKKNNINIHIINKIEDLELNIYKNELIQVLLNILGNSKDAFDGLNTDNKQIFIECQKVEQNVVVKIRDNAGGIKDDILSKIFEPYFSTKKKKNGTGLGLYMSMIIVTEHLNGVLQVENIDNGVEFRIVISIEDCVV